MGKKPQWSRFPVRTRAHSNPLSDDAFYYPAKPDELKWEEMYPTYNFDDTNGQAVRHVDVLDVGCAFGGLIVNLATVLPDSLIMGVEIREKVVAYTQERIKKLREESNHAQYNNVWAVRSNAMRYLPNYLRKGQLSKMFFCFPDPHFKKKTHKRRIISPTLLDVYAYLIKEGGKIYTITDVEELGNWMTKHLADHPLFERVPDEEVASDIVIPYIQNSSEDAKRTTEQQLNKHLSVFRRINPRNKNSSSSKNNNSDGAQQQEKQQNQ